MLLIATACVSPSASPSPTPLIAAPSATPSAETATPSPQTPEPAATATATPAPTATRTPLALPPVSASCPAARNVSVLALAKPIGADGVVGLFDARDAHNPKVLCALAIPGGRFVSATEIEYTRGTTASTQIVRRDLMTGGEQVIRPPGEVPSGFGGLAYAWGRDGKTLVYLASVDPIPASGCPCPGNSIHLVSGGTERVLGYFGEIPGRGFSAHGGDQVTALFSPSGSKFVAVDTISGSAQIAEAKSLRVYSFDGRPLLETNGTLPVWVGETLLFRGCRFENPACVKRWDGGSVTTVLSAVQWDDPVISVGTQLVAFSRWDGGCLGCVVLYDAGANTTKNLGTLRSRPMWASRTVIWWSEEERCDYPSCLAPAPTIPTDRMYAYDLNSGSETLLPFSFAYDVRPRG